LLGAIGHHLATLADEATGKQESFIEYLARVLEAEQSIRTERSRATMLKLATLPQVKTLEQLDFEAAPGLPKARLQELASQSAAERRRV